MQLAIALVTVSDTRTLDDDHSGSYLQESLQALGHRLHSRKIIPDVAALITTGVKELVLDAEVQVVITTGGTGFRKGDCTVEAIKPLIDTPIVGFGELFRQLSYAEIGTATIQSKAFAGFADDTLIFCLPGSLNACKTAWEKILKLQLDATTRPCNFAELF